MATNKVLHIGKLTKSSGDSRWYFVSETADLLTFFMSTSLYHILIELATKGWEPTFKDDEGTIYFVQR